MKNRFCFFMLAIVLALSGFAQGTLSTLNEGFEDGSMPDGWSGSGWYISDDYLVHDGDYAVYSYVSDEDRVLTTQWLAPQTGESLKFYIAISDPYDYGISEDAMFSLIAVSEDGTEDTLLTKAVSEIYDEGEEEFFEITQSLDSYVGESIQIKLSVLSTDYNDSFRVFFDDFSGVSYYPVTCFALPSYSYIQKQVTGSTTATLYWSDPNGASSFEVRYIKTDGQLSYGSSPDWGDTSAVKTIVVNDTFADLTDLEPGSYYYYAVRVLCPDGNPKATSWTTDDYYSTYFVTMPGNITAEELPYMETFESDMGKWFGYIKGGTYPSRTTYSGHLGPACVYAYMNSTYAQPGYMIGSSVIDEDLSKLRFRFWAHNSNIKLYGGWNYILGVMSDPTDTTTFVAVDTIKFSNSYKLYDYSFENYPQVSGTGAIVIWAKDGSGYDYFYFDEAEIMYEPECKGPDMASLSVKEIGETSATITWTDKHENNSDWVVMVYSLPSWTLEEMSANDKEYTIDNLTPGATYRVTVKSKCGSEYSLDTCTGIFLAIPSAEVVEVPYENTFETEDEQHQFTITGNDQGNIFTIINDGMEDPEDPTEEVHSLAFSGDGSTNTISFTGTSQTSYNYATLKVDFGEADSLFNLSFDAKSTRTSYGLSVYLLDKDVEVNETAISSAKSLVRLFDNTNTQIAGVNNWEHFIFPLTATGEKQLVFRYRNYDYSGYGNEGTMIDNIKIDPANCPVVTGLKANDTKPNDITLSWDDNGASSYIVYYMTYDDEDWSEVAVDEAKLTFSEKGITLPDDAHYRYYVRAVCDEGDTSVFSDIAGFTAICNNQITTLPYTMEASKEYRYQNIPCVTVVSNSYYSYYNSFYPYSNFNTSYVGTDDDGNYIYDTMQPYFYFSGVSGDRYQYLVLPKLSSDIDLSKLKLTTKMWNSSYTKADGYYLEVGIMDDPNDTASFVPIDIIGADETTPYSMSSVGDTNWTVNRVYFKLYEGSGKYIAIRATSGYMYLYPVIIDYTTDCEPLVLAKVDETTQTTANISWTRLNENLSNYTVYYKQTTDTAYQTMPVTFTGTGDNVTATISGLQPSTAYTYYVEGNCAGDVTTEPSNSVRFMTECGSVTALPYAMVFSNDYVTDETFADGSTAHGLYCWTLHYSSSAYSPTSTYIYNYPEVYYYSSGTSYVRFYVGYEGYYEDLSEKEQYLISPKIDESIPMNTLQVEMSASLSAYSTSKFKGYELGVMTDPNDTSTFELVAKIDSANVPQYDYSTMPDPSIITFDGYTGQGRYIALRMADTMEYASLYVYNFVIEEIDPCVAPIQLKVAGTTQDSIYYTFKPILDDQTDFVAHYKAVGGYGAEDLTEHTVNVTYTPNTTFGIGGLVMATQYELWVTTNCENAPVRQSVKASTRAKVMDFPYTSAFDPTVESDMMWTLTANDSNSWYLGKQAGQNSLFLSKNRIDTIYAQGVNGYETAMLQLNMNECDSVEVEFDLTLGGSATYDFLKVYFTPDSIVYAADNDEGVISSTDSKWAMNFKKALTGNDTIKNIIPKTNQYYISLPYEAKWFNQTGNHLPKEGINTTFHVKARMANPAKNGVGNFMFIFRNDAVTEHCWQAPVIRNFSIVEVVPPAFTVTTDSAAMISDKSATLYATMDVDAQYTLAAKGFEYKASAATDYTKVDVSGDNFVYTLNGLVPETEYTFRAFIAKNITDTTFDTVYGAELTFTTLEEQIVIVDPTVQTATPNAVWTDAATLVANVTPGTKDINEYGFEYRLASAGDDTYQSKIGTVNNTTITATITGLEVSTMYTVRGYVKTEDGTFYGNVITFSTNDTTIIDDTSSIAELSNNVTISMYPNPTSDNAVLTINGLNGAAKVILTDVQGRIIEESEIALGEDTMTINTASLESGVYYVRIVANGILRTEKLIKK